MRRVQNRCDSKKHVNANAFENKKQFEPQYGTLIVEAISKRSEINTNAHVCIGGNRIPCDDRWLTALLCTAAAGNSRMKRSKCAGLAPRNAKMD